MLQMLCFTVHTMAIECAFFLNYFKSMFQFYARQQNASRVLAIVEVSVRLFVCLYVRLCHSAIVSKRCKLRSRNLHYGLPRRL